MREQLIEKLHDASSSFRQYSLGLAITFSTTLILLIVNAIFTDTFMQSSINVSIALQKAPLEVFSFIFSYVVPGLMFGYIVLVYTIRKDIEANVVMIFSVCMLFYCQGFLKLLYMNYRPVFLTPELRSDYCVCDYGQPSGHAMTSGT